MTKKKKSLTTYERAVKRVDDIKGFYTHLSVYIIVNIILLLTRNSFNFFVVGNSAFGDSDLLNWINWETYGTPIFWGIFLIFHFISVFVKNPFLGKEWEERHIQKFIEEERPRNNYE